MKQQTNNQWKITKRKNEYNGENSTYTLTGQTMPILSGFPFAGATSSVFSSMHVFIGSMNKLCSTNKH